MTFRRIMRLTGLAVVLLLGAANATSSQSMFGDDAPTIHSFCQRYTTLYTQIREGRIAPDSARREFAAIMNGLRARFAYERDSLGVIRSTDTTFAFPLRGYGPSAIGGTSGEGYRASGFDLFDYTVRGSHPAQDIFIRDRNRDNTDDRTGQPVDVLAMRPGVVLAIETAWQPGSDYRGGNWIWVYDPALDGLFYYAHNNVVAVTPGQWVDTGDRLAEVGRSGFNAYKPRSPTHLHLMYLQLQPDGLPKPRNTYNWLVKAERY